MAAAFGVSTPTVSKWLAQFPAGGGAALSNCSSALARVAERLVRQALHLRRNRYLMKEGIARERCLSRLIAAR